MRDSSNNFNDSNAALGTTVGRDHNQTINHYHGPQPPTPEPAQPAPTETSIRPPRVWLSPNDSPNRDALATELRLRGIFVERHPHGAVDYVIKQLDETDGCVLYLTLASLQGLSSLAHELGWLKRNHTHAYWLVLEGITRERLHDHPLGNSIPWERAQIVEVNGDTIQHQCATRIAHQVTCSRYSKRVEGWFDVLFHSYDGPPSSGAHLILDWSDYFGVRGQPMQHHYWQHVERALHDVKSTLSRLGTSQLGLIPNGLHLTGAVLCGAVFSNTVRFIQECRVANIFQQQRTWWDTSMVGTWTGLRIHPVYPPRDEDTNISLEWAFFQPITTVTTRTERFLASSFAPSLTQRLQLLPEIVDQKPVEKVLIESERNAMAIAALFRQLIERPLTGTFHLFGAMPAALAVLFGRQMNACPPVQCYEFGEADTNKQSYLVSA